MSLIPESENVSQWDEPVRSRTVFGRSLESKYPPPEQGFPVADPQRGPIETDQSKSKGSGLSVHASVALPSENEEEHSPGNVKLLLPPRQEHGDLLFGLAGASHYRSRIAIMSLDKQMSCGSLTCVNEGDSR
jgi:hypothetical protein